MIDKTPAYIVRKRQDQGIPCFINGELPRPKGVTKVMVYYFNRDGDLVITLIPAKFVQEREFRLL